MSTERNCKFCDDGQMVRMFKNPGDERWTVLNLDGSKHYHNKASSSSSTAATTSSEEREAREKAIQLMHMENMESMKELKGSIDKLSGKLMDILAFMIENQRQK